ncbi:hypothetical protein AOQ84DRAFT_30295 [Glonium stellatum]|uniref:ASST-domain-containing protein n=1 Tax=Glonium stellatum TaxID=574774 RepID=A0A8E2F1Z8_9PEZI|nr:hypothetical protein AOQ84DRAFT_30295 [Glonium stellatum]
MHRFALLIVASVWLVVVAAVDNTTEPISTYVSRPDLQAPALHVSLQNADPVNGFAPGYMFICPFQATQQGPYIYDKLGNLVWSGYNAALGTNNSMDMKPCSYKGSTHLCLWQGITRQGYGLGQGIILNNNYQPVAYLDTANEAPGADIHEFNLINDGASALFTSYESLQYDLSAFSVTANPSWIMQGIFQEIDSSTGEVIFDWQSLDHVDPSGSYVMPGTTDVSGNGSAAAPWDYFHINSVDKSSATKNYLISSRHMSTVYCIDSADGHVIWQLSCGGVNASFTVEGFNFTFQHDARYILENDTHTIISIFDNASNGFNKTATESSGMVISIDLNTKVATLLSQTFAPISGGILSDSQGNTQIFSNGAVFHGWGSVPSISETNTNGEPVLFATYGAYPVMNYRAYSFPWNGFPLDKPTLVAPAQSQNVATPVVAYVSWNGATEVETWRFYGSLTNTGPFSVIGKVKKAGFETIFTSAVYYDFIFVEAVGSNGESWSNSSIIPVDTLDANGNEIMPSLSPVSNNTSTTSSTIANVTSVPFANSTSLVASSTTPLTTYLSRSSTAPSTRTAASTTSSSIAPSLDTIFPTMFAFLAFAVILIHI